MDLIPHGFDCYAFQKEEIKYFEPHLYGIKHSVQPPSQSSFKHLDTKVAAGENIMGPVLKSKPPSPAALPATSSTTTGMADYIKFTRKNEDYPREQLLAFGKAERLNMSEIDKRIFCGIKIQIGIGVVTNFLHKGMQYKPPVKGRSELVNGSWTGIMRGLTINSESPNSYDLALGNFLAWDEEFPYIKFGPFVAVESKLVILTGGSRRIQTSSFGTNMKLEIWLTILALMLVLSLLSASRIYSRNMMATSKPNGRQDRFSAPPLLLAAAANHRGHHLDASVPCDKEEMRGRKGGPPTLSVLGMFRDFFFIYFTMLLNKPSVEYDDLVWPKKHHHYSDNVTPVPRGAGCNRRLRGRSGAPRSLPSSIRALSYLWSATCLVLASIYSGEMLAVMLLHADQNIDTIAQLINAEPRIEPVIRQDDMTHNLMLKSMDVNMLKLYNITRVIPRAEVYKRSFIESVSERKIALLGDDELVETIYELYHKYYPLYKSKMTYLQFPISILYRKDLNSTLEGQLRRGMWQLFEMGLIHRWYQAQKDTYIKFYDTYERVGNKITGGANWPNDANEAGGAIEAGPGEQKYKPLSMQHFSSFFRAMLYCILFALLVLLLEIIHNKLANARRSPRQQQQQR